MPKEFHEKSVGQLLYDKVIQIAKPKKAEYVWLGIGKKMQEQYVFTRKWSR
jgi:ABC-type uncharacterized transport system ATPase subunit